MKRRTMAGLIVVGRSHRTPAGLLLTVAVALTIATVVLPWPTAARLASAPWPGPTGSTGLAQAVRDGLVSDWRAGVVPASSSVSALTAPTTFWQWFHTVKAICATGLLLVSAALAARPGPVLARIVGGAASGPALIVTLANLQGAVAPLASVLSFLPGESSAVDGGLALPGGPVSGAALQGAASTSEALTGVVDELRRAVVAGQPSPFADRLVADFSTYHAAMVGLAAVTTVTIAILAASLWRNRRRRLAGLALVAGFGFAVLALANLGTALRPAPAFAAFLAGIVT